MKSSAFRWLVDLTRVLVQLEKAHHVNLKSFMEKNVFDKLQIRGAHDLKLN